MATLALGALGASLGSSLLPGGLTAFGLGISGAALGSQVGSIVGSAIDGALFGGKPARGATSPRLETLHITSSAEGNVIPRIYGRARIGGQVIWATDLVEEIGEAASGGGKGQRTGSAESSDYRYFANVAIGLGEGSISGIGRVWADGKPFDLSRTTARVYRGTEDQQSDPLIAANTIDGQAPAYRGLAYIVFEHLALASFGNRLPQFSFEVFRPLDGFNEDIRGVVLIPGTGEFAYEPTPVVRKAGLVRTVSENTNTAQGQTDWHVSLDQLALTHPNAKSVSLVVSWFANDLRVGSAQVEPRVESQLKITSPREWSVAGLTRNAANPVSTVDGAPAYGGTPSDASVVAAIQDLKGRGHSVVFNPFLLMDVPPSSARPDPYTDAPSQPAYPWRGRITCAPAPGRLGTPDKTAAISAQLAPFVGLASASQFSISGTAVLYTGSPEWSYRRMILHYAHLAKAAGGVDAFLIGSELRGLTTLRGAAQTYPFVTALRALAGDVKAILGSATKVIYAADWSEYFGHHPQDGTGDVNFHLDALWSSPSIDAIGIDVYWPLADWRHTTTHLDESSGWNGPHDEAYLRANLQGGEGYDWFYATDLDRTNQVRTPITDGLGKPWIYRYKDLRNWWQSKHFNRLGGIEETSQTAWVPQSKPFWLMEIGCPAVDLAANQPNVFVDVKSAESAYPYFSTKQRDDLAQRRFLSTILSAFNPDHVSYVSGTNPQSSIDGRRMIDLDRIHVYAWDARPFPAFPHRTQVWRDGPNWETGHWLNGRGASVALSSLIENVVARVSSVPTSTSDLTQTVDGMVINRLSSPRDILEPLAASYFFDALERDGTFAFKSRARAAPLATFLDDDLVETKAGAALKTFTRAQETDLPIAAKLTFASALGDYAQATAESRRHARATDRILSTALPLVLDPAHATAMADSLLHEAWAARETATFGLPPSALRYEPGDVVTLPSRGVTHALRIAELSDGLHREIEAKAHDPSVYRAAPQVQRKVDIQDVDTESPPTVIFVDAPTLVSGSEHDCLIAAINLPWLGPLAVYAGADAATLKLTTTIRAPSIIGRTASPWSHGVEARLDHASTLTVEVAGGALHSTTASGLVNGANMLAIETASAVWEVVQFQTATLVAANTYALSHFLRAQRGTDLALPSAVVPVPTGARVVLLSTTTIPSGVLPDDIGRPLAWRIGPTRHAIGDATFVAVEHTITGAGLRPLSPVHVRCMRDGVGNVALSWVRRSRVDADRWDAPEIPLGEETERYEIDILTNGAGSTVKRTLVSSAPAIVYTIAHQTADFGAAQPSLTISIAQISARVGRGSARTVVV